MINIKLIVSCLFFKIFMTGCASHPAVLPETPKKGEISRGFSFAIENIVPTMWWRYGLVNIQMWVTFGDSNLR